MTNTLEDCYLKLDRADELLEETRAEVDRFLDRDPYVVQGRFFPGSDDTLHYVGTGQVRERHPPKRLRILVGDFLHNTRSALDNLTDVLSTPLGAAWRPVHRR